jgi:hypothetical protein
LSDNAKADISVVGVEQQGSVVNYFINLLGFNLHIMMLNIYGPARKVTSYKKGGFGKVMVEDINGRSVVVKRQEFRKKQALSWMEKANKA